MQDSRISELIEKSKVENSTEPFINYLKPIPKIPIENVKKINMFINKYKCKLI